MCIRDSDDTAPIFTNVLPSETRECSGPVDNLDELFGTPEVSDNCSNEVTLTTTDESIDNPCSWTVIRTWTATDECGNIATASTTIIFEDTMAPEFVFVPSGGEINCGDPVAFGEPEVSDLCLDNTLLTLTFEDSMEEGLSLIHI